MKKIKVLVIDDSAYSRRTISKMLDSFNGVEVVGYATNGEEGIHKVIALKPDLVTLDLEMPGMNGFTLLRILVNRFSIPVIIISVLSDAENVFKALELGALDFIVKPSSVASTDLLKIEDDLREKVLQSANFKMDLTKQSFVEPGHERYEQAEKILVVDETYLHPFDIVAIGASTGGPPALQNMLSAFDKAYPFSIVISQHMPPGFTKPFAERLNRCSKFSVKEAQDGDPVIPGEVLISPGGFNLVFEIHRGQVTARTVPPSQTDRFVPSVDVMFESCAGIYRNRMIAVVLTGMGNDGKTGVTRVKEKGGYVIAESQDTAIVYGMPKEAVATGLVDKILPLGQITDEILAKGQNCL